MKQQAMFDAPNWLPAEPWQEFLKMRRRSKKTAPTDFAVRLLIRRLDGFRAKGLDIGAILEESIINNWTNVYEPKNGNGNGKHREGRIDRLLRES